MIVSGSEDSQRAEDVIEKEALTLIKMDGTHAAIDYGPPYPVKHGPSERELFSAFGDFSNANMFVVNMKSELQKLNRWKLWQLPHGHPSSQQPQRASRL